MENVYGISADKVKYMDLGANHWCRGSNSYYFYKRGGKGILLEANPLLCRKLEKKRNRDIVINAAVDIQNEKGNIPFYILSLQNRSSIDKESVKRAVKMGAVIRRVIQVPCICINDLIEKYRFCPDLLSIDIEGMDYKVLRSLDLDKYRIKVIIVEISNDIPNASETMEVYMQKKGYCIYAKKGSNVIYRLI